MNRILSILLIVSLALTLSIGAAFADPGNGNGLGQVKNFKDIKGHWGNASIMKMQSLGLLNGYEDGTFRPDNTLAHTELAVILSQLQEKRTGIKAEQSLEDIELEDLKGIPSWAKKAVKQGIDGNYLNLKRFHSQVQVDRLTACIELAKVLKLTPVPVSEYPADNPFKDSGLISDADYGYILALYNEGLIKGYPDGNFNPNRLLSRADFATILANLYDKDKDDDVDDTSKPTWSKDSTITATAIGATNVTLKWTGAEDNAKVTGYNVKYYLNGLERNKITAADTMKIENLLPDTSYTFEIEAKDAAGNWSVDGPSITVKTLKAADTTAPTWPTGAGLTITQSGINVTVEWPDAMGDDIEYYRISVLEVVKNSDDELAANKRTTSTEAVFTDLDEDTQYIFKVRARDIAGNWSPLLEKTYTTN